MAAQSAPSGAARRASACLRRRQGRRQGHPKGGVLFKPVPPQPPRALFQAIPDHPHPQKKAAERVEYQRAQRVQRRKGPGGPLGQQARPAQHPVGGGAVQRQQLPHKQTARVPKQKALCGNVRRQQAAKGHPRPALAAGAPPRGPHQQLHPAKKSRAEHRQRPAAKAPRLAPVCVQQQPADVKPAQQIGERRPGPLDAGGCKRGLPLYGRGRPRAFVIRRGLFCQGLARPLGRTGTGGAGSALQRFVFHIQFPHFMAVPALFSACR